ncbi:MAG: JAB domain-containing protein [Bacillota bacterium]
MDLIKARKGAVKPNHKYTRREWDPKASGWRYFYDEPLERNPYFREQLSLFDHVSGQQPPTQKKQGRNVALTREKEKTQQHNDNVKSNLRLKLEQDGYYNVHSTSIQGPEDVAEIFRDLKDSDREKLLVANMDAKGKLLNVQVVTVGTINASLSHPREMFKASLLSKAKKVYFIHNHPSGDSGPSQEDVNLTKKLREAGKTIGIDTLGHVVIGEDNYSLINDEGYISKHSYGEEKVRTKKVPKVDITQQRMTGSISASEAIRSPEDVARLTRDLIDPGKDGLWVIALSTKNMINAAVALTLDMAKAPREAVKAAITSNAAGTILVGNGAKVKLQKLVEEIQKTLKKTGVDLLDMVQVMENQETMSWRQAGMLEKAIRAFVWIKKMGVDFIKREG